jgi:hypothetical protein
MPSTVSATSRQFHFAARVGCASKLSLTDPGAVLCAAARQQCSGCNKLGGIADWVCVLLSRNFGLSDKVAVNTCGQFERDL